MSENRRKILGSNIKSIRGDKKKSQAWLAENAGVSISTIIRLESGESDSLDNLLNVASALETTVGALLGESSLPPSTSLLPGYGERIRIHRSILGLNQSELGQDIGLDDQAISRWETEKERPDEQEQAAIARSLGVATKILFPTQADQETPITFDRAIETLLKEHEELMQLKAQVVRLRNHQSAQSGGGHLIQDELVLIDSFRRRGPIEQQALLYYLTSDEQFLAKWKSLRQKSGLNLESIHLEEQVLRRNVWK